MTYAWNRSERILRVLRRTAGQARSLPFDIAFVRAQIALMDRLEDLGLILDQLTEGELFAIAATVEVAEGTED